LNESLQRGSYAKDRIAGHLLRPGQVETINFENTFIISKKIAKDSRIVSHYL